MTSPNKMRLLVVEDEYLVATGLEAILQAAGYTVVGPVPGLEDALEAATGPPADLALLDVNLAGRQSYPVADALSSRQVPFIFLTGCDGADLPSRFAGIPVLIKPFSPDGLLLAVGRALGKKGTAIAL